MSQTWSVGEGVGDVEFPDDMSDKDIMNHINTVMLPQAKKDNALRTAMNVVRTVTPGAMGPNPSALLDPQSVVQGATLGWGIPAQAALAAAMDHGSKTGFKDLYQHYKQVLADDQNKYANTNAATQVQTQASTAVGATLPAMAASQMVPAAAPGIANFATRSLTGAFGGGAVGTIGGAGQAETQGTNPAGPMTVGGAVGTALGVVSPALAALRSPIQKLAQQAGLDLGGEAGGTTAQNAGLRALQQDNISPEAALADQQTRILQGQPAMAADVGGANTIGLGRGAAAVPGPAREQIETALNDRAAPKAAFTRISGNIEDMANVSPPQVRAAYAKANPQELTGLGDEFLRVPEYRENFEAARAALLKRAPQAAPKPLYGEDEEGNPTLLRDPTVQDFDLVKRTMDQKNAVLATNDNAAEKVAASPAADAQNDYMGRVDAVAPDYETARGLSQREIVAKELMERARRAATSGQAFPNIAKTVAGGDSLGTEDLLDTYNPTEVGRFDTLMGGERGMTNTRSQTLLGSNTVTKGSDVVNNMLEAGKFIADAKTGGLTGIARYLGGKFNDHAQLAMNEELAGGLYAPGRTDFLESLVRLNRARQALQNRNMAGSPAYAAISAQDAGNSY